MGRKGGRERRKEEGKAGERARRKEEEGSQREVLFLQEMCKQAPPTDGEQENGSALGKE